MSGVELWRFTPSQDSFTHIEIVNYLKKNSIKATFGRRLINVVITAPYKTQT